MVNGMLEELNITVPVALHLDHGSYAVSYTHLDVYKRQDMELVQLVSFGCGVDAITTDEVREILESKNKIYTQIKIEDVYKRHVLQILKRQEKFVTISVLIPTTS